MTNEMIVRTMDDAERAAKAMAASGFFADSKSAAQAVVKILAGSELGFGPFASMTGVNIIQNKPVLAANLMAAAVKRQGKYNYRVIELTDTGCELAFLEDDQEIGRSKFVKADAEKAQLLAKDNWKKYPRNMYFARALSNGQKWYAPDVFNGATVYTPDELGAVVDEEGNPVYVDLVAEPDPEPTPEPTVKKTWTAGQRNALIGAQLAKDDFGAKGMLGLSNLPMDASDTLIVAWGTEYRKIRPLATPPGSPVAKEAAEKANAWYDEYKKTI